MMSKETNGFKKGLKDPDVVQTHYGDASDNRLIFGDNLLALKALEREFLAKVKLCYIDPPFNTKQLLEHYNDRREHSDWLDFIRDRIKAIRRLLSDDGSLFVHIDANELGYLIVLIDEIFGRANRCGIITFRQSSTSGVKAANPGLVTTTNYLLLYAKNRNMWSPNRVFVPGPRDTRYSKFIENYESYKKWRLIGLREAFLKNFGLVSWNEAKAKYLDNLEAKMHDFVVLNAHRVVRTASINPIDVNKSARKVLEKSNSDSHRVYCSSRKTKGSYYFFKGYHLIFYKSKTHIIDGKLCTALPLTNLWNDISSNNLHKEGGFKFLKGKKPEALIKRCIDLATKPCDIVLDVFAGSGTTGAVAHKMGRRWIMVEIGNHCLTHIIPRLQSIVQGKDTNGISKTVGWQSGGGFRYYKL